MNDLALCGLDDLNQYFTGTGSCLSLTFSGPDRIVGVVDNAAVSVYEVGHAVGNVGAGAGHREEV